MNRRPVLAATAAVAALAVCAASGTASAATATSAAGKATTSMSVLDLAVAGHELSLVDLALLSDTTTSPTASSVSVTPVTVDGTAYGTQTVGKGESKALTPVATPSALAAVAALTSPALEVAATATPSNHAGATSLGSVNLLGMPISLAGALEAATSVSSATGAEGLKTVTVQNLALPSVNDLLAALGLDLSKLPVDAVNDLVNQLDLVTTAISTAQTAVDTAQAAVDAAVADLNSKITALNAAQGTLTTAQAGLATAQATLNALLTPAALALLAPLGITDAASAVAAAAPVLAAAEALVPGITAAVNGVVSATTAVNDATSAVAAAQALVDTAQALVTSLQNALAGALTTLGGLLIGKLDTTPLVSLDRLEVSTRALVTSATAGGQHAEIVDGVVDGLKVLGTDVLQTALGSSAVDIGAIAGAALTQVNSVVSTLTGTLSSVLSSVPSLPALEVPAPQVGLLTKTVSTDVADGFGRASTAVSGLTIAIPGITVPSAVAVPGAASLPALGGVTQVAGQLTSAPISLDVLTLRDQAAFRPAVVPGGSSGTTGNPTLPNTGMPTGVAALSLLLMGGALAMRRRALTEA